MKIIIRLIQLRLSLSINPKSQFYIWSHILKFFYIILFSSNLIYSQNQKTKSLPAKVSPTKPEQAKQTETQVDTKESKQELRDKIRESLKKRELGRFGDKRF